MARKIKNAVMIILIIALCASMYFTVTAQRKGFQNGKQRFEMSLEEGENMIRGETPEMPEGEEGKMEQRPERGQNGEMNTPPAKPEGESSDMANPPELPEGMKMPENAGEMTRGQRPDNMGGSFARGNMINTILVAAEALGIALFSIYLIMSKFNQKTFKETLLGVKKILAYIVLVGIVTIVVTGLVNYLTRNNMGTMPNMPMEEETTEKETTAEDVDAGETVTDENIDLSKYSSNITISKAGTYTLTGEFANAVLVNADGEVTLNLNNVTIKNETNAAIANAGTNGIIINLPENTSNILSDGGSSEYDGCIFSAGPLTITGTGSLDIHGNQKEGEGIATDTNDITINGGNIKIECNDDGINAGGDGGTITINDGTVYIKASGDGIDSNKNVIINGGNIYSMGSSVGGDAGMDADEGIEINGGEVIALGSDMLEKPLDTSKQTSLCFNLSESVQSGATITLKNEDNEEITSFTADENFKTLILSNSKLKTGKYYLYSGTEQIAKIENN